MDIDKPKRILLIQLKRAGDVIVTTPLFRSLRLLLPESQIDFLVDPPFAPLLENNPFVNTVHLFDRRAPWKTWMLLRTASYDWILDFQSSPRSILAGLFSRARIRAGYRVPFWGKFLNHTIKRPGNDVSVTEGKINLVRSLRPDLGSSGERKIYLSAEERDWAKRQLGAGEKGAVGLIPTHRRPSRRWPAAAYAELARRYLSQGRPVWLFWGPGEEDYVKEIEQQAQGSRMIPSASLRQMAALLERCEVVVTNDNGPMHLATAVGTPTVTLYGPTDPTSWNPGGAGHLVLQAPGLSCLGCNLNDCPFGHECMTWIKPENVYEVAQNLVATSAVSSR